MLKIARKFVRAIRLKGALDKWRRFWIAVGCPEGARVHRSVIIESPIFWPVGEGLEIDERAYLGAGCRLVLIKANRLAPSADGHIHIGRDVQVTSSLQVYSARRVTIEERVLIAANVFITDCTHGTGEGPVPYRDQPYAGMEEVRIGRGAWLGQNCVILPGVTVGEFAVIGANSVVTRSIPPRSIAVGSPARVIKVWDDEQRLWRPA